MSENELHEAGAAITEGLFASQVWIEDKDFAERYKKKFGANATNLNMSLASIGYDTIKCLSALKKSIEEDGKPFTSESVHQNLPGFRCSGATGSFAISKDRLSDKRERIVVVTNGQFQAAQ